MLKKRILATLAAMVLTASIAGVTATADTSELVLDSDFSTVEFSGNSEVTINSYVSSTTTESFPGTTAWQGLIRAGSGGGYVKICSEAGDKFARLKRETGKTPYLLATIQDAEASNPLKKDAYYKLSMQVKGYTNGERQLEFGIYVPATRPLGKVTINDTTDWHTVTCWFRLPEYVSPTSTVYKALYFLVANSNTEFAIKDVSLTEQTDEWTFFESTDFSEHYEATGYKDNGAWVSHIVTGSEISAPTAGTTVKAVRTYPYLMSEVADLGADATAATAALPAVVSGKLVTGQYAGGETPTMLLSSLHNIASISAMPQHTNYFSVHYLDISATDIALDSDTATLKLFVWNDMASIKPLVGTAGGTITPLVQQITPAA